MTEQDKANLREALRLVELVANNNALQISDAIAMRLRGEWAKMNPSSKSLATIPNAERSIRFILHRS